MTQSAGRRSESEPVESFGAVARGFSVPSEPGEPDHLLPWDCNLPSFVLRLYGGPPIAIRQEERAPGSGGNVYDWRGNVKDSFGPDARVVGVSTPALVRSPHLLYHGEHQSRRISISALK